MNYKENHYVPCWYQERFLPTAGERKFRYLDLTPKQFRDPKGVVRTRTPSFYIWRAGSIGLRLPEKPAIAFCPSTLREPTSGLPGYTHTILNLARGDRPASINAMRSVALITLLMGQAVEAFEWAERNENVFHHAMESRAGRQAEHD